MKTVLYRLFGLLICLTLFSCNSDDSGSSSSEFFVEYKVDNKTYKLTDTYAIALTKYQYTPDYVTYTLGGTNLGGQVMINQLAIVFTQLNEGSFNATPESGTISMIYTDGPTEKTYSTYYCNNTGGTLNIESISGDVVEGTFSMEVTEDINDTESLCNGARKSITNGKFRLKLQNI